MPDFCGSRFALEARQSSLKNRSTGSLLNVTMLANSLSGILLLIMVLLTCGSLLSLSTNPHWFVRGWDFPRLQIVVLAWLLTAIYFLLRHLTNGESVVPVWLFVALGVFLTVWNGLQIIPYTPLSPLHVKSAAGVSATDPRHAGSTFRLVISNVEKENEQYELWMQTIEAADPDVLVVLEIDQRWVRATDRLIQQYPHRVIQPQNNWYGMWMLSRLPIESQEVRYLVQDDVPSIDATIHLQGKTRVRIVAVHPRPPEPIRDNDSVARDAELTLWGQELSGNHGPVVICGDLNDVAWSHTTRLFLRTSGLLDPRRGRGLFNTFNANHFFQRFPVDHVFVSPHFKVCGIERLPFVGSDHFPMRIDLRFEPEQHGEQKALESQDSDDREASERIERAIEDPKMDGEIIEALRGSAGATR